MTAVLIRASRKSYREIIYLPSDIYLAKWELHPVTFAAFYSLEAGHWIQLH